MVAWSQPFNRAAERKRYKICNLVVSVDFIDWKFELSKQGETKLHRYQCPWGSYDSEFPYGLSWPPKNENYASIDFDAASIKWVTDTFPDAKEEGFIHDLCSSRERIYSDDGSRKPDSQLYSPKLFKEQKQFYLQTLRKLRSKVRFVFSGESGRIIEKEFKVLYVNGNSKYRIVTDATDDGIECAIVFLPHPEYAMRWAHQDVLDRVIALLCQVQADISVRVDFDRLK